MKEVIHISNRDKGGMDPNQMQQLIVDALPELPADILGLIYRIVFYAESGME